MDSSFWFDIINWDTPLYIGVSVYNFKKNIVFFCLKIFFTFTNSVDHDELCCISSGSSLFAKVQVSGFS